MTSCLKRTQSKKYHLDEKEFDAVLDTIVNKYEPFDPLWSLLPSLKQGYKLAILNNGTALTLSRFREKYNLDGQFDLFVSSAIEQMKKPDKEIYLLTAKRLGFDPEECLFMDDSESNVQGAQNCGMKTIWWKDRSIGFAQFENFLALDR